MNDYIFLGLVILASLLWLRWVTRRWIGPPVDRKALCKHLRTVLVADDSTTIRKVLELSFMDVCEVVAVASGREAVEALDRNDFDLVIADVHMGAVSGYDVCRHAKARRPEVPVILLRGAFEPFDEQAFRGCGADAKLKKPFEAQAVLAKAAELCVPG